MRTIHKYQLDAPITKLMVPAYSTLLTIHEQRGKICVWYEVDTDEPLEEKVFQIYMTGEEVSDCGKWHHGTVFLANGSLVLHVYELPGER